MSLGSKLAGLESFTFGEGVGADRVAGRGAGIGAADAEAQIALQRMPPSVEMDRGVPPALPPALPPASVVSVGGRGAAFNGRSHRRRKLGTAGRDGG